MRIRYGARVRDKEEREREFMERIKYSDDPSRGTPYPT
jgi:hypothetical protein